MALLSEYQLCGFVYTLSIKHPSFCMLSCPCVLAVTPSLFGGISVHKSRTVSLVGPTSSMTLFAVRPHFAAFTSLVSGSHLDATGRDCALFNLCKNQKLFHYWFVTFDTSYKCTHSILQPLTFGMLTTTYFWGCSSKSESKSESSSTLISRSGMLSFGNY